MLWTVRLVTTVKGEIVLVVEGEVSMKGTGIEMLSHQSSLTTNNQAIYSYIMHVVQINKNAVGL